MDALALLCNLHADGPATLQRLRRLGCESIDAVAALGECELGQELRQGAGAAARFKREAHNLLVRMQGGTALPEPDAELAEQAETEPRPTAVEHVLKAWREMDDESPPTQPGSQGSPLAQAQAEESKSLANTAVDGLSAPLVKRLAELHIRRLGELADAPSLQLSQELPLALTRVRRLQLMARRVLAEEPAAAQPAASHVEADAQPAARDSTPEPIIVLQPAVHAFEASPAQGSGEEGESSAPQGRVEAPAAHQIESEPKRSSQAEAPAAQGSSGEAKARDPELDRLDSAGPFA